MLPVIVAGVVIFGVVIGLLMTTNRNGSGANYSVVRTNTSVAKVVNGSPANPTVYTNSAPNSVLPQTKQTPAGKFELVGTWKGKFNNVPATLEITTQKGETFSGTLRKNGYLVEFTGRLNKESRAVSIKETKVLKTPSDSIWNLGKDIGSISEDGREMSGTGADQRVSYDWSFTRQ
jgi:hypothetical protein